MVRVLGEEFFVQPIGLGNPRIALLGVQRLTRGDPQRLAPLQIERLLEFLRQVGPLGNLLQIRQGLLAIAGPLQSPQEFNVGLARGAKANEYGKCQTT